MHRIAFYALLIFSCVSFGCSDQGKQFAATTDRIAGYVGTGLIIVDQQTTTGQMSAETGVAIVTVLRQVNTLNGQLVTEAKTYVQPDGTLALTGDGQQKLLAILASSTSIVNTLTNDPRVLALPDTQKTQINALVVNLGATIATLGELVKTVKLVKGGK